MILALKFASQRGVVLDNIVVNEDEFAGAIARRRIDVAGHAVRGPALVTNSLANLTPAGGLTIVPIGSRAPSVFGCGLSSLVWSFDYY